MKKLSLLLAIVMLISSIGLAAMAEEPAPAATGSRFQSYDEVNAAITIIKAEGDQVELGYLEGVTEILEVDGLKFKDLNKNGKLDVYEDWRADIDDRVWDLIGQMTLEEKAGLFYHVNTCGNPSGVDFADSRYMFGMEEDFPAEETAPAEDAAPAEGEGASSSEPAGEDASSGEPAGEDASSGEPAGEDASSGEPAGEDASSGEPAGEDASSGEPAAEGDGEEESAGGPGGGGGGGFETKSMWYYISVLNITTHLDNTNGTPAQQSVYHNAMQALGEDTRLGIPIVISNDRQYNAWGGMIDTAHDAFGAANDLELSRKLWTKYSLESRAVGIHVVLHPYGEELGSWNGEDPEYAGTMTKEETLCIQTEGGTDACMKHFIARGGDSDFQGARSDAQTVDNWMTAWRIALEANPKWVMTNGYGTGLTNSVHVDYDAETMNYLRETLGYEGIIVSDWGAQGDGMTGDGPTGGVTLDGVNLLEITMAERYAYCINLGLDQIGNPAADYSGDGRTGAASRGAMEEALTLGLVSEERANETYYRVLKDKFELGLFENPYVDANKALALAASEEYIAEPWDIVDNDTLMAARNPEIVALERELQAKSAILFKNDDNLLPLEKGTKVYIDSTAAALTLDGYKKVLPDYAELVDEIEDADVVIADCTQINDAAEQIIDDAKDEGKKLVIVANCVDPTTYILESGDAVLGLTFSRPADHGTGAGGFITTTEPIMLAKLLFGEAQPEGMVVKELARNADADEAQWKDLAGDQGANQYVRMMLLATMKTSENNTTPNNWGDPLVQYKYGMRYGSEAKFEYEALVLPRVIKITETESNGSTMTSSESVVETKAGEPFDIYFLMWNKGDDGMTTVEVKCDDEVIASKIMAINSGDWRVVQMTVTVDAVGEHVISVGDLNKTISIVE